MDLGNYDSWKCSAPEDERGYWSNRPPEPVPSAEIRAQTLVDVGTRAARVLAGIDGSSVSFGSSVPVEVVRAVARLVGRPMRIHLFERERMIEVVDFYVEGVEVRLQGHRLATAAEIAAGAK